MKPNKIDFETLSLQNYVSQRVYTKKDGWTDKELSLSEDQISMLTETFCAGCKQETKDRFKRRLKAPGTLPSYGIFERVYIWPESVRYVGGQDHSSEIKTVRELILKG